MVRWQLASIDGTPIEESAAIDVHSSSDALERNYMGQTGHVL
jgi:hypothetical protein